MKEISLKLMGDKDSEFILTLGRKYEITLMVISPNKHGAEFKCNRSEFVAFLRNAHDLCETRVEESKYD